MGLAGKWMEIKNWNIDGKGERTVSKNHQRGWKLNREGARRRKTKREVGL
jgi:hypothetical protein